MQAAIEKEKVLKTRTENGEAHPVHHTTLKIELGVIVGTCAREIVKRYTVGPGFVKRCT